MRFPRTLSCLLPVFAVGACSSAPSEATDDSSSADMMFFNPDPGPIGIMTVALSDRPFYFRSLGARCLDFGGQASWAVGGPVYIYGCNGSVAQQVRVREIDQTHDVELRVQSLYCIGVRGGTVAVGQPLELQTCNGSPAQRFAVDGDAILVGKQTSGTVTRDFVIEPQNDATPNRTPLVVGTREASEAEYFRMQAVDGSSARPTTGFVTVTTEAELDAAIARGWGTVVEIGVPTLDLTAIDGDGATPWKRVAAGTTIRGDRKFTNFGPTIRFARTTWAAGDRVFVVDSDHVRFTGFHLQGPTRSTDENPYITGITIVDGHDVLVDHIEGSDWTAAPVAVQSTDDCDLVTTCRNPSCPTSLPTFPRKTPVRIVSSFFHHNERWGGGYGVVVGTGAFPLIQGNVGYLNRHMISADGHALSGYLAYDNFVLSDAVDYWPWHEKQQDFDKHGGDYNGDSWDSGISGDYADIEFNTFLGTGRLNFDERGTPCRFTAVQGNVFLQSKGDAIHTNSTIPTRDQLDPNQYLSSSSSPINDLAVGDFDGDHVDDVFIGTGAAWYFSPGGSRDWRFLSRKPERASQLRFGDFDGDGRTDVLALHGSGISRIDVSWGGVSPFQTINYVSWSLSDLAIGDFDGDHLADIFLATGTDWYYVSGGKTWVSFAHQPQRTPDLRFGDFTADGRTDVFGVVDGYWQMYRSGGTQWEFMRPAPAPTLAGMVVADFDGDGYADIARNGNGATPGYYGWQYAARGWGGFIDLRTSANSSQILTQLPIGRFDGDAKADVLVWVGDGRHFGIASAGHDPTPTWSSQEMR